MLLAKSSDSNTKRFPKSRFGFLKFPKAIQRCAQGMEASRQFRITFRQAIPLNPERLTKRIFAFPTVPRVPDNHSLPKKCFSQLRMPVASRVSRDSDGFPGQSHALLPICCVIQHCSKSAQRISHG